MKKNLGKIWLLSKNKYLFFLQIFITLMLSLIHIYIGNFAKNVVDYGLLENRIIQILLNLLMITAIGSILSYTNVLVRSQFSIKLVESVRHVLMEKIMKIKFAYFENEHSGKLTNKLSYDVDMIQNYISGSFVEFLSNALIFISCFIYLLTVNYTMTLLCAISVPITLIFVKIVVDPIYKTMDQFSDKMDDVTSIAKDTILGVNIEKAYNIQEARKKKFNDNMDEATVHYVKYEKIVSITGPFEYMIKALPTFICIAIGFINAYRGNITNGEFIVFVLLLKNISNPLSNLPSYITQFKEALVSFDRLCGVLDLEEEVFGNEISKSDIIAFEFNHVKFHYDNGTSILEDLSFTIKKGQITALVGASGCGKSTIFKLLTGFHLPNKGQVKLFGKSLEEWDIELAREKIALVSQDTHIFPETVATNIGYGKTSATMDEIIQAAKLGYAHDFIMKLPEGYQTKLAEWGANLSGGQKQRIAIARAFLKDAPIILLDEMTSALDVESERLIQKSLENYGKDKTVVVIAHRLSTILNADEIIVLDKGQVVERGKHKELVELKGVYNKLYSNQLLEVTP
jgi:ABC-type multidrug transport system fused ATPase/permease subunit